MRNQLFLAVTLFLLAGLAAAQEGVRVVRPPSATKAQSPKAGPDKEEAKHGLALLQVMEADAGALQGGMRAWADWQLARGYQPFDKAKALELLDNGLTATRELPTTT